MSSLSIDELKKILAENGVPLPSGRMKKEDYISLYEDNVVLNRSAEAYSDDESQNSRKVSSTDRFDSQEIAETIRGLTDDELFNKLTEMGFSAGPVVKSSRSIYEKKLMKLIKLSTNGNGVSETNGQFNTNEEFSDQEERQRTPTPPPRQVSVPPPEVQPVRESSVPRRYTFVEKISRVSKERIIQPVPSDGGDLRFRPTSDISDGYRGRWSPSATIKAQAKIPVKNEPRSFRALFTIGGLILLGALVYVGYVLLPSADQYQLLEDDAVAHARATGSQTV